jgi:hypothetical protein
MTYQFSDATNVKEGAILLDKEKPGWYNKIDINRLDMTGHRSCILGQLYGEYEIGDTALFGKNERRSDDDMAFGSEVDKNEWIKEIEARQPDFKWALSQIEHNVKVCHPARSEKYFYARSSLDIIKDDKSITVGISRLNELARLSPEWKVYEPEIILKVGTKVKFEEVIYIVAEVAVNKFALININTGGRWTDAVDKPLLENLVGKNYKQYLSKFFVF